VEELKTEIKNEVMMEVKRLISELTASVNKNFEQIDRNFDKVYGTIKRELSGRRERQP
jgi:hypothetical protein